MIYHDEVQYSVTVSLIYPPELEKIKEATEMASSASHLDINLDLTLVTFLLGHVTRELI